jgi:hypothetical protein
MDFIRKRGMSEYEFTHLMVEILGYQEVMLRYVIVHSFTSPRLSESGTDSEALPNGDSEALLSAPEI